MEIPIGAREKGSSGGVAREALSSVKPTNSSEEGHGRVGDAGVQPGNLAVAPVLDPALRDPSSDLGEFGDGSVSPVRSVSGVVAAPSGSGELEEGHTTVDAGPAQRFEQSQAALSRRIRSAMDQTLPLGTPVPDASLFAEARQNRALHARTMLLGGRHLVGLGAVSPEPTPEPETRRAEPAALRAEPTTRWADPAAFREEPPISRDVATPRAPDVVSPTRRMPLGYEGLTSPSPAGASPGWLSSAGPSRGVPAREPRPADLRPAEPHSPEVHSPEATPPREGALRASFVRPVGLPTVPPPRRRRTLPPGGLFAPEEDQEHEAFALDRPRGSSFPPVTSAPGHSPPAAPAILSPASLPPRTAPGAGPGLPAAASSTGLSSTIVSATAAVLAAPGAGASPRFPGMDVRNPHSNVLSNSVILPPPPQASDFELSSSPSTAPPPLALAATARAGSSPGVPAVLPPGRAATSGGAAAAGPVAIPAGAARALTTKPAARSTASLLDLPSADPLAGYEAPREGYLQRFLIVFVVALAVVGLFALGAIALGFLGKTGW